MILKFLEKVDSNVQKQDLIMSENIVSRIKLYTFLAILELNITNKKYVIMEKNLFRK